MPARGPNKLNHELKAEIRVPKVGGETFRRLIKVCTWDDVGHLISEAEIHDSCALAFQTSRILPEEIPQPPTFSDDSPRKMAVIWICLSSGANFGPVCPEEIRSSIELSKDRLVMYAVFVLKDLAPDWAIKDIYMNVSEAAPTSHKAALTQAWRNEM